MQEKAMTKEYAAGKFPSAAFLVFSNRALAVWAGMGFSLWRHGTLRMEAPMKAFVPNALSNSLSSYAQYEALRYVSFQLQTLSKSTKVIPVMLMGKVLNGQSYKWVDYFDAIAISVGVSMFSLSEKSAKGEVTTQLLGILLLAVYIGCDSFTAQYQSKVFKQYACDQFQMMYASNLVAIVLTTTWLLMSGEMLESLSFLARSPDAIIDNVTIAITSATGQLFIFYTIKRFGPVVFVIIMTTRQMLSMMISSMAFNHPLGAMGYFAAAIVFGSIFFKAWRQAKAREQKKAESKGNGSHGDVIGKSDSSEGSKAQGAGRPAE
jgi:adenosine 3'-phospho 5'-phosphosulfate transporter B2